MISFIYLFIQTVGDRKKPNSIIFILCHLYFILTVGIIFPGPHIVRKAPRI